MKKFWLTLVIFILVSGLTITLFSKSAYAQCRAGYDNQCDPPDCGVGTCIIDDSAEECYCIGVPNNGGTSTNPFGEIENPLPYGSNAPGSGLITILNNALRLIFVVAGIYAFIRILLAGFKFITAGADPKKISEAQNSIWQSLVGLIIVISSIAVAALIGLLLFGDATAILSPQIYGPQ